MLSVGTDLLSAINILIADFDKPSVKSFLYEVQDNLSHGQRFYKAFERYPTVFSLTFVNLVKAAEESGTLQTTFDELSIDLSREAELRGRVRSALAYPIILLVVSVLVILFLVIFALPRIAKVFNESGVKPPLFSQIVFSVGLFMGDHILLLLAIFLLTAGGSAYFFWRTEYGRRLLNRALTRLPLTGKIYRELAIQRFASTLSALMRAGVPVIQALNVTADTVGHDEFRLSLRRISSEGLTKGLTIGEAFRRETVFPKVVTNLIAISESAGHLDKVLETLGEFYATNVEAGIKTLVSFLEPALLLTMGSFVAILALSIILPIYQLTSQF